LYLAKVYVTLKPTVNDPQGLTVLATLRNLGFAAATDVRVGKYASTWKRWRRSDQLSAVSDPLKADG